MRLFLSQLHTVQTMTQSLKSRWWLVVDALVLTHSSRGLPWEARVILTADRAQTRDPKSCEIPGFIYVLFLWVSLQRVLLGYYTQDGGVAHSKLGNLSKSCKQLGFIFIPPSLSLLWKGSQSSPFVFNHPFFEAISVEVKLMKLFIAFCHTSVIVHIYC